MAEASNCEMCNNFVYDDEDECYVCDMVWMRMIWYVF